MGHHSDMVACQGKALRVGMQESRLLHVTFVCANGGHQRLLSRFRSRRHGTSVRCTAVRRRTIESNWASVSNVDRMKYCESYEMYVHGMTNGSVERE